MGVFKERPMESENQLLSKKDTAVVLGMDVKTLTRWIAKGYFPGPAVIENGVKWWTTQQVNHHLDDPA